MGTYKVCCHVAQTGEGFRAIVDAIPQGEGLQALRNQSRAYTTSYFAREACASLALAMNDRLLREGHEVAAVEWNDTLVSEAPEA
jgi:hypothetical protein